MDFKYISLILVGLIVIGFAGVFTVQALQTDNITKQYEIAKKKFADGDYEASIEAYKDVLELNPLHVDARIELAECFKLLSKIDDAKSLLLDGIELKADESKFYSSLSSLYLELTDIVAAIDILEKGIQATNEASLQEGVETIQSNVFIHVKRALVQKGHNRHLTLVWKNHENKRIPLIAEWNANNENIGSLNTNKLGDRLTFSAEEEGKVTLTATLGSLTREIELEVRNHVLAEMTIEPENLDSIEIGEQVTFTVSGLDANGEEMEFNPSWTLDQEIGEFSHHEGLQTTFTALKEGAAKITVVYEDRKKEFDIMIEGNNKTITKEFSGEGEILLSPEQETYPVNTRITIEAIPKEGWTFVRWEGDTFGTMNPATVIVTKSMTLRAVFEQNSPTTHSITVNTTGEGEVVKSTNLIEIPHNDSITLTAKPRSGWKFERWEGTVQSTSQQITIKMDSDKTIRAYFSQIKEDEPVTAPAPTLYTFSSSVTGEGQITKNHSGNSFEQGTQLTITASPLPGWKFQRWSGSVEGTSGTISLTMDGNKSVQAIFIKEEPEVKEFSLGTSVQGNGSISNSHGGSVFTEGTVVTLTANPAEGWEFVGWSGDDSGQSATISVTMNQNRNIVAIFEQMGE